MSEAATFSANAQYRSSLFTTQIVSGHTLFIGLDLSAAFEMFDQSVLSIKTKTCLSGFASGLSYVDSLYYLY